MSATIVILGATGDLTARYLLPAIGQLVERDLLDHDLRLVGVANDDHDDASFRTHVEHSLTDHAPRVAPDARSAVVARSSASTSPPASVNESAWALLAACVPSLAPGIGRTPSCSMSHRSATCAGLLEYLSPISRSRARTGCAFSRQLPRK